MWKEALEKEKAAKPLLPVCTSTSRDLALKKTLALNVAELWAEFDSDLNTEDRALVYFLFVAIQIINPKSTTSLGPIPFCEMQTDPTEVWTSGHQTTTVSKDKKYKDIIQLLMANAMSGFLKCMLSYCSPSFQGYFRNDGLRHTHNDLFQSGTETGSKGVADEIYGMGHVEQLSPKAFALMTVKPVLSLSSYLISGTRCFISADRFLPN